MTEHRRVPHLSGDRVVVVHRVEVARGTGVAHEVGAARASRRRAAGPRRRRTDRRSGRWQSSWRRSVARRRGAKVTRLSDRLLAFRPMTGAASERGRADAWPGAAGPGPADAGPDPRRRRRRVRRPRLPRGPGRRHREGRRGLPRHVLPVLRVNKQDLFRAIAEGIAAEMAALASSSPPWVARTRRCSATGSSGSTRSTNGTGASSRPGPRPRSPTATSGARLATS